MGIGKGNQWRIELGRDAYLVIFIFEIVRDKTKSNDIGGMVRIMSNLDDCANEYFFVQSYVIYNLVAEEKIYNKKKKNKREIQMGIRPLPTPWIRAPCNRTNYCSLCI